MRIFIGHDTRYKKATLVCQKSIREFNPDIKISWLDKHKLKAKVIDSNFILIGKNQYGNESFNGIIRINNSSDKIEIKRRDNHFKFLIGSKFIYKKVNYSDTTN